MKIKAKSIYFGISLGILFAVLISCIPTAIDWYINPAELFHNQSGTNWSIIFETWFSWFLPFALLLVPMLILFHAWMNNRRNRQKSNRNK